MKLLLKLTGGVTAVTMLGLMALPSLLAGVVAPHLLSAGAPAAGWDIPPQLVPVLQESGRAAGVPWALLAGVASVATDFGRHGPDGVPRGDNLATSIYPVLEPPLSGGTFLIDPARTDLASGDTLDVRTSAGWLAGVLSSAVRAGPQYSASDERGYWIRVAASLPVRITAIAPRAPDLAAAAPPQPVDDLNPVRRFGRGLLARIGAPVTTANLDAIAAWAAGEGSCAAFNPLDTTQPEPAATPFNTLAGGGHVWNYPSLDTGIRATAETLLNGLYQPVMAALQAGTGTAEVAAAVRRSPWGTGVFGSPSFAGRSCGRPPEPPPGPQAPTVTGPDAIAATIVARAAWYQAIWVRIPSGHLP